MELNLMIIRDEGRWRERDIEKQKEREGVREGWAGSTVCLSDASA